MIKPFNIATKGFLSRSLKKTLTYATVGFLAYLGESKVEIIEDSLITNSIVNVSNFTNSAYLNSVAIKDLTWFSEVTNELVFKSIIRDAEEWSSLIKGGLVVDSAIESDLEVASAVKIDVTTNSKITNKKNSKSKIT